MRPFNVEPYERSIACYSAWLGRQNSKAYKNWRALLSGSNVEQQEGAVAEAVAWDFLAVHTEENVWSFEDASSGGPDFLFEGTGNRFVVEVTNVSRQAATSASGMDPDRPFSGCYSLVTQKLQDKVFHKERQLQRVTQSIPRLVFVTTLHPNVSTSCFRRHGVECAMTSEPAITMDWNPATGEAVGEFYNSTDLARSVFLHASGLVDTDPVLRAAVREVEEEVARRDTASSLDDEIRAMLDGATDDMNAGKVIPLTDALIASVKAEGRDRIRSKRQ